MIIVKVVIPVAFMNTVELMIEIVVMIMMIEKVVLGMMIVMAMTIVMIVMIGIYELIVIIHHVIVVFADTPMAVGHFVGGVFDRSIAISMSQSNFIRLSRSGSIWISGNDPIRMPFGWSIRMSESITGRFIWMNCQNKVFIYAVVFFVSRRRDIIDEVHGERGSGARRSGARRSGAMRRKRRRRFLWVEIIRVDISTHSFKACSFGGDHRCCGSSSYS